MNFKKVREKELKARKAVCEFIIRVANDKNAQPYELETMASLVSNLPFSYDFGDVPIISVEELTERTRTRRYEGHKFAVVDVYDDREVFIAGTDDLLRAVWHAYRMNRWRRKLNHEITVFEIIH